MANRRKIATIAGGIAALGLVLIRVFMVVRARRTKHGPVVIQGAIVKHNTDTRRESPIEDVAVSAADGLTKSDFSGYFRLTLPPQIMPGQSVELNFQHPDYLPAKLQATVGDHLYVVEMAPVHGEVEAALDEKQVMVTNVLVRYSIASTTFENIGSGEKTFQV